MEQQTTSADDQHHHQPLSPVQDQEHSLEPCTNIGQVLPSLSSSSDTTTSEESSKDGSLEEERAQRKVHKEKKKPRSEASVLHDKERGVCSCKYCGWIYPNPRPSAKLRREHRRHCSKVGSVHAWLGGDQSEEQGEEMDEDYVKAGPEAQKDGKVDEVPTGDNDELTNVECIPITSEISTGKDERSEVAASSSPHDNPEEHQHQHQPQLESSSSALEESSSLHDPELQKLETSSSLSGIEQKLAMELGSSSETSPPPLALETGSTSHDHDEDLRSRSPGHLDLEKILKEQTSHHLLCPNCGSCITRRVILKKRKRTVSTTTQLQQEIKLPKLEEPKPDARVDVETETTRSVELGGEEAEAWGCLACFSIFFHKVREQLQEPLERAHQFSCLPYLLPDFHWNGEGYTTSQESPERERSICLPIEFPWSRDTGQQQQVSEPETREVEILIDPTEPNKPISLPDIDWKVHEQQETDSLQSKDESSSSCFPVKFPSLQTREEGHGEGQESRDQVECLPVLLPRYWGLEEENTAEAQSESDQTRASFNCLPALIPGYGWRSSSATSKQNLLDVEVSRDTPQLTPSDPKVPKDRVDQPSTTSETEVEGSQTVTEEPTASLPSQLEEQPVEETQETTEDHTSVCLPLKLPNWTSQTAGLNCLPAILPAFSWDGDGIPHGIQREKTEDDNVCLPITFPPTWRWTEAGHAEEENLEDKTYVTKETRIKAWIKTITNVVTVKSGEKREDTKVVDTKQETSFLNMTVTQGLEKETKTETLVKTPSTGWALVEALDKETEGKLPPKLETMEELEEEDDVKLVDSRRKKQTEIEELQSETKQTQGVQDVLSEFRKRQQVDELKQPLLPSMEELDVEDLLLKLTEEREQPPPTPGSLSTTVAVRSPDSFIQVTGDDPRQAVVTALGLADVATSAAEEPEHFEYVKSIIYGGLDVTLTSLTVVSSGAGSGTNTLNVLAISLANLVAGLITLLHSIGSLYQNDRASFEHYVGKRLWVNGGLSVVSFLVFGSIAPLTYGLSFRSLDDRDYKFAVTALASLVCIGLMGLGKAYVQKRSFVATIVNLVLTGFVASVTGYFVGDYVKRWLEKMGYNDQPPASPPSPPAPPPPPVFLKKHGVELGRRGRT